MNAVYPLAANAFLNGDIDWASDSIKVTLVDADYTYSAAHDFYADVPSGARIATASLAGKASSDGTAYGAASFNTVPAGSTVKGIVIWQDTGADATSRLIAFMDTAGDTTPISLSTNGGDIDVAWPIDRIFKL